MTTIEFRSTPELVSAMRQILEMDAIKQWLEVMESENPINETTGSAPHEAHVAFGKAQGWRKFKTDFLLGGTGFVAAGKLPDQEYPDPPEQT